MVQDSIAQIIRKLLASMETPRIITIFMKAVIGSNISHLNPFPSSYSTFLKRISKVLDTPRLDLARDQLS